MCGIAGLYTAPNYTGPMDELLLAMAGELAHRGPDGVGLYLDERVGLVNTRLAIVDIGGGDQPLPSEDGRYWVVQNGEIYNYLELMRELELLGHRFSTRSDTEVLVHAFEEWGVEFLERLNGEFALAIHDRNTGRLLLARDRFGIRPLFLAGLGGELNGDVAFASEAKALLRHPRAERRIDHLALVETFTIWAVQPDRSAFVGIHELPPGHYLWVEPDGVGEPIKWWDLNFAPEGGRRSEPADELAEELLELLNDSTRLRLRADVPVGVYLSGGLDSSATAALARRHTSGPLEAFSVAFEDARFDESAYQDRMAEALGVRLNRITVTDAEVADAFPEVVRLAEKPMLRTSPGPLMLLAASTHEHGYRVVLTGEGSDELLGGYQIFQESRVRRFWAREPASSLRPRLLGRLYPYLSRDLAKGGGLMTEFFRSGIEDLDDPLYSHRPRFRTTSRNLKFLSAEVRGAGQAGEPEERILSRLPTDFGSFGPLGRAQYVEIATFLQGFLLHSQGDRMLMGSSIEGRFPFLDYRVAEFAAALPERLRMNGIREKYLLRKALAPLLPSEINSRPKRPYRAPILRPFFGSGAPAYVGELLDPDKVARTDLFQPSLVAKLVRKAGANAEAGLSESDEMGLVGILSTMLLHEQLIERPQLAPAARPTRVVIGGRLQRAENVGIPS